MRFRITNIGNNPSDSNYFDIDVDYLEDDNSAFRASNTLTLVKQNYRSQQAILDYIASEVIFQYDRVNINDIINVIYDADTVMPV